MWKSINFLLCIRKFYQQISVNNFMIRFENFLVYFIIYLIFFGKIMFLFFFKKTHFSTFFSIVDMLKTLLIVLSQRDFLKEKLLKICYSLISLISSFISISTAGEVAIFFSITSTEDIMVEWFLLNSLPILGYDISVIVLMRYIVTCLA